MPQHKPGWITASTVSPLLTGKGDKLISGGVTHCKKLALERSGLIDATTILNAEFTGNTATEWGHENEADAILMYEQHRFADVHSKQIQIEKPDTWLSCTPDGLIDDDGMIEVKCPYSEYVFLEYLLDSHTLRAQYEDQVQFQLMLSGRAYCDLVAYHPHYADGSNIVIVRVEPDKDWQDRAMNRINQAEELIEAILESLKPRPITGL